MFPPRFPFVTRALLGLILIWVGYIAEKRSVGAALSVTQPIQALGVSGGDARIMARAALQMMERASSEEDRSTAVALARKSLARDAMTLPAIDTLGLAAGISGDVRVADRWFTYAQRLSRRDMPTQLYFIEKSVADGDVKAAIRHYDVALRTSQERGPLVLFPVLRSAIGDQTIRQELARTLAKKPLWADSFVADLVTKGPDFAAAAQLLLDARRVGMAITPAIDEALLNNLVAHGDVASAWQYYVAVHPAAQNILIRNGSFEARRSGTTPFDWQVTSGDGASVDIGSNDAGRSLSYRLSPTVGATIARQLTLLRSGQYRLESVMSEGSQTLRSGPYWEMKCADGRSIVSLEMGGPFPSSRSFSTDFALPVNCEVQALTLTVRSSDDLNGATGRIESISIKRIQ